ncbi:MAG: DNA adenine methylase [Fimbriimonadales bacterium]|nr:DNA adenine methylase [Fimbriimonadales bacterium]
MRDGDGTQAAAKNRRNGKLLAFGWYGGKYSHLDWLLPLLPPAHHYCEPFGGSAAVLLNREPSPVETYNDIDGEVVNFFRVLRDRPEELIRQIALTPFSRKELEIACSESSKNLPDIERARRFYVRARQTRTGLAQTATPGRWAYCIATSRAGVAGAISRWFGGIEELFYIADRLLRVQIENLPATEVIQKYDSEETLFYCDPPYVHHVRGDKNAYAYEMSDREHIELAEILHSVKGKVAISGYRCELMECLYRDWHCTEAPPRLCHSVKTMRQEVLWTNYDPQEVIQLNLSRSSKLVTKRHQLDLISP